MKNFPSSVSLSLAAFLLVLAGGGGKIPGIWHAAALVLIGTGGVFLWRKEDFSPSAHPLLPWFLAALAWGTLSAFNSLCPAEAVFRLSDFVAFAFFGVLVFFLWNETHRRFFRVMLGAAALVQALIWTAGAWRDDPPFALLPGNIFYSALWVVVGAFLTLGAGLSRENGMPSASRLRVWLIAAGIFMLVSLAWTSSRAAIAAAAAGAGVFLVRRFGRRGILGFLLLGAIAVAVIPAGRWTGAFKLDDPLSLKRTSIWTSALLGVADRPFLGWGAGQFETLYRRYARPNEGLPVRFGLSTPWAHNDYLQIAAEWGIPAAFLLLGGFLYSCRRRISGIDPGDEAALAAFSVGAMFNFPLALPVLGLLAAYLLSAPDRPSSTKPLPSLFRRGLVLLLIPFGLMHSLRLISEGLGMAGFSGAALAADPWNAVKRLDQAEAALHPTGGNPDVKRAEELLDHLVRRCPVQAEGWHALAHLLLSHRAPPRTEDGADALKRALIAHPTQAVWHVELSGVLDDLGEIAGARAAAHQALRLEPFYAEAALQLGRIMTRAGDTDTAERWLTSWPQYRRAVRFPFISPSVEGLLSSGYAQTVLVFDPDDFEIETARAQFAGNHPHKALRTLGGLPSASPNRLRLEAAIHYSLRNFSEAEKRLLQLLEIRPDDPAARKNLEILRQSRRR